MVAAERQPVDDELAGSLQITHYRVVFIFCSLMAVCRAHFFRGLSLPSCLVTARQCNMLVSDAFVSTSDIALFRVLSEP